MSEIAAVVLAAGDGKRMKSSRSKVCCTVCGKPMLLWVLDCCAALGIGERDCCVVVSDAENGVRELLPDGTVTAVQAERKGTGHAVQTALPFLREAKQNGVRFVTVLCGDAPLVTAEVLASALALHKKEENSVTVLTAELDDPARYGRIVRENGVFSAIVEAADASEAQLQLREINAGAYWFSIDYLIASLPLLNSQNVQGELYLTDLVEMAAGCGGKAGAFICPDADAARGANSRAELAQLNEAAQRKIFAKHYDTGVDIPVTDGIIIGPDVVIAPDTTVLPGCILMGKTVIGKGCVIGPNTTVIDCEIGGGCTVDSSRLQDSRVGNGVRIGPFAQLRPGCVVADNAKIGNFVELKNSTIGEKTSFAHLTYAGDSDFGAGVNVGCGVVTVNYNGKEKSRTVVEDDAFIGCNTNLIAPVKVGKGAYIAAATTVTEAVEPDALAIGRVRQSQKPGYALRYRKK